MRVGRAGGWVAAVAVATSGVVGAEAADARPAAPAQVANRPVAVVGNFVGSVNTPQEEVFTYVPGAGQDTMRTFSSPTGGNGGTVTSTIRNYTVSGSYRPVAGNFDGDLRDEILWYGPGGTADSIWDFGEFGTVTSRPVSVSGDYQPLVVDWGADGDDDVLWYGSGTAADHVWEFQLPPSGTGDAGYTSRPLTINGTYRPFVGNLLQEDGPVTPEVVWYGPGAAPDVMWETTPGGVVSTPLSAGGDHRPFTFYWGDLGREAIWWFSPSGPDAFWYEYYGNWITGNGWDRAEGDYVGQAVQAFPGDPLTTESVVWTAPDGTLHLWHHGTLPNSSEDRRYDYTFAPGATSASPAPAYTGPPASGP